MKVNNLFLLTSLSAVFSGWTPVSGESTGRPESVTILSNKLSGDTIKDQSGKQIILEPFSIKWENSRDSKLNLSFLLDKPAGRDGFVTVKDGHLIKPSGERFRIWGVNMTGGACFPEKKDAPLVAAFLSRFGINTVRLHFLDSNWDQERSLFDFRLNTTRELYPPQLDKLDFFISELKKAGIYTDINLNVGRTYRKDDGVPEFEYLGFAKAVTLFDDHIIGLEKEYAKQLLTHINPYTGNAYINEPAVAIVEIVNENSLVEAWFDGRLLGEKTSMVNTTWMDIPPYYGKELTGKFNRWLKENYNPSDVGKIEKEAGVKNGEVIPRLSPEEFKNASELRFHAESKFIINTERSFFTGMYNYLKKELNVGSMIVANSDHNHYRSSYALLSSISLLDIVDGHVYWQHPSDSLDEKTGKHFSVIENTPMVNDPGFSTVVALSRSAVEGKPYIVSETNHPFPNEFACEGIPVLGAYALLQDWDGIIYYTLEHAPPDKWNTNYSGSFGMGLDPVKMPGMAATGLMFLRGDLKAAESCIYRGYSKDDIIEGIRETSDHKPYFTEGFSTLLPLIEKTRIRTFDGKTGNYPLIKKDADIKAETGEIIWHVNKNNFVEVSSSRTESLSGFLSPNTSVVKHLKVNIKNEFASVTLTSLDNKPLESSNSMLLIATGRTGMSGMEWSDDRKRLIVPGEKPTTVEVISGQIIINGLSGAKEIIVEPLDGSGNPMKSIILEVKKGTLTLDVGEYITVWYYLTVKR